MPKDSLLHERLFRGPDTLERIARLRVTICGAGALGSHLTDSLARQGFRQLAVIDDDRVEAHNVSTQLSSLSDVGMMKVHVLRSLVFRATGIELEPVGRRLDARNAASLLRGSDVAVDTFDNSASRRALAEHAAAAGIPCLHLGLNGGYAEVRWDRDYRVPSDVGAPDACEYPLARNLIVLAVATGCESLVRFATTGNMESFCITLGDLTVSRWAG